MDIKTCAIREEAVGYAWDLGCNIALVNTLKSSQSVEELKQVANAASGVGSNRLHKWLLNRLEEEGG